jgi:hypothetical protein
MVRLAALLSVVSLAVAVAASVSTASGDTGYKANVNAVCARNTPSFSKYISALLAAERVKNEAAVGINLGLLLRLMQQQNQQLYAVPVPSSARRPMTLIFKQLHAEDNVLSGVFNAMLQQNTTQLTANWSELGTILPTLKTLFNRYSLNACGSQPLLK